MELLNARKFFPPLAAWGAMIKIVGWDTPIPWLAVHDIGVMAANFFEDPDTWIGRDSEVFGDVKTMRQCQEAFMEIQKKKPLRVPLCIWMFQKIAGEEFVMMWQWLDDQIKKRGSQFLYRTLEESRQVYPNMLDLEGWLKMQSNGAGTQAPQ